MLHPKTDVFWQASDGQSPWTLAYPLCQKEKHLRSLSRTRLSLRGDRFNAFFARHMIVDGSKRQYKLYEDRMLMGKNYFDSRKFHQQQLLKRAIELARADENDYGRKTDSTFLKVK